MSSNQNITSLLEKLRKEIYTLQNVVEREKLISIMNELDNKRNIPLNSVWLDKVLERVLDRLDE